MINRKGRPRQDGQTKTTYFQTHFTKHQPPRQGIRRITKAVLVRLAIDGHISALVAEWLIYAGGLVHE